jgi:hypothetical protein
MHAKITRAVRIPSLFLAAALQVLPIVRAALPVAESAANVLAIVFRWAAGAAAALGGVQSVSGASTVITNPLSTNLVQGTPFTMRLTTAPELAHYWTATPLPPGLTLSGTSGSSLWYITGTPTAAGTTSVQLSAMDQASSGPSRTATATLIITVAPNSSPPKITTQPTSQTVAQGQNATFSVTATGATPLNYQWRFNGTDLSGQTGSTLAFSPATTNDAGSYAVLVSNNFGSVTSAIVTLTVNAAGATAPSITTQPANQTVTQGQNATFSVVATGSAPLSYFWRKGTTVVAGPASATFTIANAQTTDAGSYSVIVSNSAGIATSASATLTVNATSQTPYIVTPPTSQTVFSGAPATFTVVAGGTAPLRYQWYFNNVALNNQTGASLTLASVRPANAGAYFVMVSNRRGSITSPSVQLALISVSGTYSGLYYEANNISILSSGSFVATVTGGGGYSAALTLLGRRYALSGRFNSSGLATNVIRRGTLNTLSVQLQLDLAGGDQISGQVTDGSWTAQLLADRAVFNAVNNPAPQAGAYTLIISGTPGAIQGPAGNGFGTVKVNAAGRIIFAGTLADGTRLAQSATISKSGTWPLYSALYISEGSILGWLTFANRPGDDINGQLSWTKLQQPSTRYYPGGFAFQPDAIGSKFTPPSTGTAALSFGAGIVALTDGNLVLSITNQITLGTNNRVSNAGGTKVMLSLVPSTGLVTGTVIDPTTGGSIVVRGAILQKQNLGYGFFLGTSPGWGMNRSGWFYFGP